MSTLAIWCRLVRSRDVHPYDMVPFCQISRCQVSRFQRPRFSVRVDAHYTTSLRSIQGVLYELLIGFMLVSSSFCFFSYCYVRQTKLASSELSGQRLGAL